MKNKKILALAALALAAAFPAQALDSSVLRQLKALDIAERREQRCDMEAMARIAREQQGYRPDKVIAYTFADPVEKGNLVQAPGAVFRSRGDWYRLKFKCETGERGLKVHSFKYKVGDKVPREEWERYYLYD
ncbi:MAG: DUF930 domain-containing protein [Alphaproteobacteria bacterium]|uniref:DUF930 domain-containing protein n=1 Tax=Pseudorhizobium pelagicum TaxID=1509405 RepID=UPI001DF59389|nr:DUF930 domain-containing protein [Alphaproteobacteria bacterium]MBU1551161.1 DUF930 domain-containing protein [Alphaproteobacteria bacterium]MBU2334970.1 DUF930 domain-containing protein [Alphaproteobacteria bacterium]MBU2388840.1 DUF930 domain-containing protein [Alphaproteobacteria bacterium]|tara:strand:+ start:2686 stop:3081 length:396 start_codon:yes stop_codon:yes gene_type:complete